MRFNHTLRDAVFSHLHHIGVNAYTYTPLKSGVTEENLVQLMTDLRLRAEWVDNKQHYLIGVDCQLAPREFLVDARKRALEAIYAFTPKDLAGITDTTPAAIYAARSKAKWHVRNWHMTCHLAAGAKPQFDFNDHHGKHLPTEEQ